MSNSDSLEAMDIEILRILVQLKDQGVGKEWLSERLGYSLVLIDYYFGRLRDMGYIQHHGFDQQYEIPYYLTQKARELLVAEGSDLNRL